MDITGIDLVAVGGIITSTGTAVASVIKAFQAKKEAASASQRATEIELARERTKKARDKEIEGLKSEVRVLKVLHQETKERLAEGTSQFKELDNKVDTTNKILNQILGALKNSGLKFNGGDL